MKTSAIVVLCVALTAYGVAAYQPARHLLDATAKQGNEAESTNAFAGVSGSIKAVDGSVTLLAKANSEAFAKAESAIAVIFLKAIAKVKGGGDAVAIVKGAAFASAKAIAKAYASSFVAIKSTGSGNKACAVAAAKAEATALAFAKAYAKGIAVAANKENLAIAEVDATAIAAATAEAFAAAKSAGCIFGKGKLVAFQESFAASIVEVYAAAAVAAFAKVTDKGADAKIIAAAKTDVKEKTFAATQGGAFVDIFDGFGKAKSDGVADAKTTELKACNGYEAYCCGSNWGCHGYVKKGYILHYREDPVCTC